jgi:exonuclease SbcC
MRIEKLKIVNVNSIKGAWEIDFTDPAYDSGIFSITGPTGAGKSTVLDALCLSLFGTTPRLGKISASGNEAMNRESTSCEAECTFQVAGGRYRTCWSQKRARNKTDGKLQDAQHAIYRQNDDGSYDCLESGKKNTQKKIEEVLGLDYEQFTRSVLLAQGNFASLLKADASAKSQILEDITGTGIYSVIGQKVYERCKSERAHWEDLKKKADASPVLKPEERALLEQELKNAADADLLLAQKEKTLREALRWRTALDRLLSEKEQLREKKQLQEAGRPKIEQMQAEITACEQAESIEPAHSALEDSSARVLSLTGEENKLQQELHRLRLESDAALTAKSEAENKLESAKQAAAALKPVLITVRELDSRIKTLQPNLTEQEHNLAELGQSIQTRETNLRTLCNSLEKKRTAECELEKWFEGHPGIKLLAEKKEALAWQADNYAKRSEELRKILNRQLPDCRKAISEKSALIKTLKSAVKELSETQENLKAQKKALEDSSAELFGSTADITAESRMLEGKKHSADELSKELKELRDKDRTIEEYGEVIRTKERELAGKLKDLEALKERKAEKEALLEQLKKLEQLQKYEADRARLRDSEPCPLCGAKEHPYCHEMPESMRVLAGQIDETDAQIKNLENQFGKLDKDIVKTETEMNSAQDALSKAKAALAAGIGAIRSMIPETVDADNRTAVEQYLLNVKREYAELNGALSKKIELFNEQKQKIHEISNKLDEVSEKLSRAEADHNTEDRKLDELVLKEQQLHEQSDAIKEELSQNEQSILDSYGTLLSEEEKKNIPLAFAELQKKCSELENKENEKQELNGEIPLLKEKISGLNESLSADAKRKKELTAQRDNLQKDLTELKHRRITLFADKDPNTEEDKAESAAREAGQTAREAGSRHAELSNAESSARGRLDTLEKQLKEAVSKETENKEIWENSLKDSPFKNAELWKKALSIKSRKAEFRTELDRFSTRDRILEDNEKQLQNQIAASEAQKPTEHDAKELEQQVGAVSRERSSNSETLGGLREKISRDNAALEERKALDAEIRAQEDIYTEWKKLDELIGSADGKKYRTIVQGITFKALLQYANSALRNLSPRYLLIEGEGLNVSVTDLDLGGETRPSTNLSGGETFLVSLALALGLSRMASRKIRISSLFLDEGFGTLDERSLEDALNALSLMNQPGNLIGVISHVGKIHERIPVGIRITPSGTGDSTLTGNGVHRA